MFFQTVPLRKIKVQQKRRTPQSGWLKSRFGAHLKINKAEKRESFSNCLAKFRKFIYNGKDRAKRLDSLSSGTDITIKNREFQNDHGRFGNYGSRDDKRFPVFAVIGRGDEGSGGGI